MSAAATAPGRVAVHHQSLEICSGFVEALKGKDLAARSEAAKELQAFLSSAHKQSLVTAKDAAREAGLVTALLAAVVLTPHGDAEADLAENAVCGLATLARNNGKNRLAIRDAGGVGSTVKSLSNALQRGGEGIGFAEECLELLVALTDERDPSSSQPLAKSVVSEGGLDVLISVLAQPSYSGISASRCPKLAIEAFANVAAAGGLDASEACARHLGASEQVRLKRRTEPKERLPCSVLLRSPPLSSCPPYPRLSPLKPAVALLPRRAGDFARLQPVDGASQRQRRLDLPGDTLLSAFRVPAERQYLLRPY